MMEFVNGKDDIPYIMFSLVVLTILKNMSSSMGRRASPSNAWLGHLRAAIVALPGPQRSCVERTDGDGKAMVFGKI